MKRYVLITFFILYSFASSLSWASEVPCSEFEFYIKAHEVQAYIKEDGIKVSGANRKEHCREIFLGTKKWAEGFRNNALEFWPYKEQFKLWTKNEKEVILKIISNWPDVFQQWKGATLHRVAKSQFKNNPAASLPKGNAIIFYNNFFTHVNRPAVLTHELSHIYVLELVPDKLDRILKLSGWERTVTNRPKNGPEKINL